MFSLFFLWAVLPLAAVIAGRTFDIDNDDIIADTFDILPGDPAVTSPSETEKAVIAGDNDGADFPAVKINFQITDIAQPPAVADIDHLFIAQIVQRTAHKMMQIRPFEPSLMMRQSVSESLARASSGI